MKEKIKRYLFKKEKKKFIGDYIFVYYAIWPQVWPKLGAGYRLNIRKYFIKEFLHVNYYSKVLNSVTFLEHELFKTKYRKQISSLFFFKTLYFWCIYFIKFFLSNRSYLNFIYWSEMFMFNKNSYFNSFFINVYFFKDFFIKNKFLIKKFLRRKKKFKERFKSLLYFRRRKRKKKKLIS